MQPIARNISANISRSPGRISIIGYALLIAAGTVLLLLPVSTVAGHMRIVDALFTAASAVCVTGLTVVDTSGTFTLFGKTVIMLLIQVGGVGIMVLSTIFLLSIGRRVSMTGRMLIRDTYSFTEGNGVLPLIKDVFLFTLIIELAGAAVMFPRFYVSHPVDEAVFFSVFHSVSAFCNAGFSLFPDSFAGFYDDWLINLDICALIILGGIGFVVLTEIKQKFSFSRRCWSYFSLHTKLVLSSTLVLLAISTVIIFLLEWSNTLSDMTLQQKVLASFFQAVNTRTAGFNTVQIGDLTNEALFIMVILMFIGTSPGSCGGGVKVTTFYLARFLRGRRKSDHLFQSDYFGHFPVFRARTSPCF